MMIGDALSRDYDGYGNVDAWRHRDICGWQVEYGTGRERYCTLPRRPGYVYCREHVQSAVTDYRTPLRKLQA